MSELSRPGGHSALPSAPDEPMPPEVAETIASYNQIASEYAARWSGLYLERALGAFAHHVRGQRRVLDLGCGPGRDIAFLTALGCRAVGLDLSAGMLAEACQRLPNATLVLGDLRRLPFGPRVFDGVWACASLLHVRRSQLSLALAEARRLLRRPDGVFFLALKRGQGEQWVTDERGWRSFFTYYEPSEIEAALRHARFEVLDQWVEADKAGRDEAWLNVVSRVEGDQ